MPSHIATARYFGRWHHWEVSLLGLFLLWLSCSGAAFAQAVATPSPLMARRTHAVSEVVLGIISYTQWPISLPQLQLCVLAKPLYAGALLNGALASEGLKIVARQMDIDDPRLGRDCNVVYLGAVTDTQRQKIFEQLSGHPVLSISDADAVCAAGSMFCLYVEDTDTVRFKTNLDSVARSGVRVDPHVLLLSHPGTGSKP
ncbi:hypothetical protein B0E48_09000 [Rhodanobacter sp. C03]|nr:hypothetical protein B0E48_09000 [Rhodanobacter sp. C03]